MATGYVRQSAAQMVAGAQANLSDIYNNEFNQLQSAFSASTGHNHDGSTGGGAALTRAALSGLSANGIVVATSSTAFTARTLTGTANELTVTNGSGVSGNPTISIPTSLTFTGKTITGGTYAGIVINASSTINASVIGGVTPAAITGTTITANTGFVGNLTGNASGSAATLSPGRTIGIAGSTGLSATGVAFDGSTNINLTLTGTLGLAFGGTNADLSATGGTSRVLMQTSSGAAITVAQLAASNLSNGATGSGAVVLATSATLITPVLGVATATSINGLTISTSTGTLTIANSKVLTLSNTLTFTGTDSSSVAFGTGGTVAYVANKLSVFAATSSSELAGIISDETGTGALVFAASPTFTGTVLGAASTWSGLVTAGTFVPTSSSAPTNGMYLYAANILGFSTNSVAGAILDASGGWTAGALTSLSGIAGVALTLSGLTASSAVATDGSKNLVSVTNTGSGNNVLATSPALTTPNIGTPSAGTLTSCTGLPYAGISSAASTSFTPTWTGFTATTPTATTRYILLGRFCFVTINTTVNGTSNATGFTMTLPFTASAVAQTIGGLIGTDAGALTTTVGTIASSGTTIVFCKGTSLTAATWTNSGNKSIIGNFVYETA